MNHHAAESQSTRPDFADVYSKFSACLQPSDIPASVMAAARLNVYDTLACSVAGFRAPGVQEVLELVRDWGGKPEADVLWADLRVPAPQAAWINGIMSHACDYDDTHDKAILHGGISVVPAAIAAAGIAGHKVSGSEFYAAVVSGLEMICRIGVATKIGLIEAGFIYSALFSYFAATATAARVLRLSPEETLNAIGIAYTQAAGTHQVTRDGALTKRMQPGFGARAALTSAAMARKGIRGAQNVFEGIDGLGRTYLRSALDSEVLREGLGQRWHMADLAYKPYPCCRMNHCPIDSALQLRAQPGFDWAQVTEIRVYINSQGNQACGVPIEIRRAPKTVVQAQFSIPYNVATALITGQVGLSDFTPEALARPDILKLAALVTLIVDDEFERTMGRNVTPARIEAVAGGKVSTAQVLMAKGGIDVPMSAADLRRKLEDCLSFGGFSAGRADAYEQGIALLENSSDVTADIRQLVGSVIAR
jgi:2-methylcitrate dehydratase PrpD